MKNQINNHTWIDLGLPSGTKWATCNVGATSPEKYGNYYAWGETTTKDYYGWDTYKYVKNNVLTKYCSKKNYGYDDITDKLTTLEATDDAATANCGNEWRTPTSAEWKELIDNCTWNWTTLKGVKGYEVKGQNGNTIFLPAAGCRCYDYSYSAGYYGYYWSSSLYIGIPYYAWHTNFLANNMGRGLNNRYYGRTVRPVLK